MYDIYTKKVEDSFIGSGEESLIAEKGIILAHTRTWDDPWATPNTQAVHSGLSGQSASKRGKGWRKWTSFKAENAQGWAQDMIDIYELHT